MKFHLRYCVSVFPRGTRRNILNEIVLHPASIAQKDLNFLANIFQITVGHLPIRLYQVDGYQIEIFLNELEFPHPIPEVQKMGKVLTVNEGSVSALEHVHVPAGDLQEDLTLQAGWRRRIRRQDPSVPDLVTNQRHGEIDQRGDEDIPLRPWRNRLAVFVHDLDITAPRRDPQSPASRMLAGDVSDLPGTITVENLAPENFLDFFTHEGVQGSGGGHDRPLRRNPDTVPFREQCQLVDGLGIGQNEIRRA